MAGRYPGQGYRTSVARSYGGAGFQSSLEGRVRAATRALDLAIQATVDPAGTLLNHILDPKLVDRVRDSLGSVPPAGRRAAAREIGTAAARLARLARLALRLEPLGRLLDLYDLLGVAQQLANEFRPAVGPSTGFKVGAGWYPQISCGAPEAGPYPGFGACGQTGFYQPAQRGQIKATNGSVTQLGYVGPVYQMTFLLNAQTPGPFGNDQGQTAISYSAPRGSGYVQPPAPTYSMEPPVQPARFLPQMGRGTVSDPAPSGGLLGTLDPFTLTPGAPAFDPEALPWWAIPLRVPNPLRLPDLQHVGSYTPPDTSAPAKQPPVTSGPTIEVGSGGSVTEGGGGEPPTILRPPPRRTKERKVAISAGAALLLRTVGHVTEGVDLIKAFHDALPYKDKSSLYWDGTRWRRSKVSHNPARMLEDLYKHWADVDMKEAFRNVVANQIDDTVQGTLGSKQGKANRDSGRAIGFTAGSGNWNQQAPGVDYGPSLGRSFADWAIQ